jgi:hypothetical protein
MTSFTSEKSRTGLGCERDRPGLYGRQLKYVVNRMVHVRAALLRITVDGATVVLRVINRAAPGVDSVSHSSKVTDRILSF